MGLAQQLRTFSTDELAELFLARPDLVERPPANVDQLAARAGTWASQLLAINHLNLFEYQLCDLLGMTPRPGDREALAELCGPTVELAQVDAALRRLHGLALVEYASSKVTVNGDLAQRPGPAAGLGRPARRLLASRPVDELRRIARQLNARPELNGKAALIDEIARRLETPELVRRLLDDAPVEVAALLDRLEGRGSVHIAIAERFGRQPGDEGHPGVAWLVSHGLVVEVSWGNGELCAEAGLAWRGGLPYPAMAAESPELTPIPHSPGVDATAEAAAAAHRIVDLLSRVITDCEADPPPMLKSGGVGVRTVRRVAALTALDERDAAALVELAGACGFFDPQDEVIRPLPAAHAWLALEPADRWLHVLRSWIDADVWIRVAGFRPRLDDGDDDLVGVLDDRVDPDDEPADGGTVRLDKPIPPLTQGEGGRHPILQRRAMLDVLAAAPPGHAVERVNLASVVFFHRPAAWSLSPVFPMEMLDWLMAEAELIGVAALGCLAPAVRLELAGNTEGARAALVATLPAPEDHFILQADLTALAMAPLTPDVAATLASLTDTENRGNATVFRFTPKSIGRALTAGTSQQDILDFLAKHSSSGVPGPLQSLVSDIGRRYGRAVVGPASSYLRSDDAALLAEVTNHRKLSRLQLRLIAPTVAVSTVGPAALADALRAAGYLPAVEDSQGELVLARRPAPPVQRPHRRVLRAGPDVAPPSGDAAERAREIARRLLAGTPARPPAKEKAKPSPPSISLFDDDLDDLDDLDHLDDLVDVDDLDDPGFLTASPPSRRREPPTESEVQSEQILHAMMAEAASPPPPMRPGNEPGSPRSMRLVSIVTTLNLASNRLLGVRVSIEPKVQLGEHSWEGPEHVLEGTVVEVSFERVRLLCPTCPAVHDVKMTDVIRVEAVPRRPGRSRR